MTKSHLVRVIAAIVDERQLTLYKENGETLSITQGDPRLAAIIQHITPILAEGAGAVAEVDLGPETQDDNSYRHYEEQSQGKISFFKVAKSRLAGWLTKAAQALEVPKVSSQVLGLPPQLTQKPEPVIETTKAAKALSVVAEIMAHAQPVAHPEFHDRDTGNNGDSTIVAVVGDKVVADIEKLKPQLKHAVANASTKGMDLFMQRCAAVADKRRHSVEDLLKFLEKGDLPIADDGTIVIYKALRRVDDDYYVDCHTGNVKQRVGSYVSMEANMVDPSRNQDCSNGLHVARRSYLQSFSGDVIVLAKVNPEDVIAVPQYDASKMRVCGYHILFEVSQDGYRKLKSNQAFTSTEEAQIQLGRALAGDHPEPIEEVKITEHHGGGIKVIPWITVPAAPLEVTTEPVHFIEGVLGAKTPASAPADTVVEAAPAPTPVKEKPVVKATKVIPDKVVEIKTVPKVDPKAVVKAVTKAKAEIETRAVKAQRLFADFGENKSLEAAQSLLAYKKSTKLGWEALGLKADIGAQLQFVLDQNQDK